MSDQSNAVRVEALKPHTYNGQKYGIGDQYDFYPVDNPSGISAEAQIESLERTGFAKLAPKPAPKEPKPKK